jgi:hypothetical protein
MSLALAKRAEKVAAARGVSKVARSPRGFMAAWKRGEIDDYWCRRRAAFLKRHVAQAAQSGEVMWKNGQPTRRHLALVMWAWTPTPGRLAAWLRKGA